jgi:uncharacterized protein
MIEVPYNQLQPETLAALIEDFITRQGAVHGHHETAMSSQIAQVKKQLESGKAAIMFDETDETWTIVPVDRRD